MAQATVVLLLLVAAGGVHSQSTAPAEESAPSTRPDIRALEIRSDVRYRYARTEVFSRVANPANESQEVTFKAVLPDAAFVSAFAITVGGHVYPARVEGREEARQEYQAAVRAGRTAAHVQVNARHANLFTVSLNVAARDKAAFNLTYEQLLAREQGRYRLRIMLDPGQVVQRLLVEARIRDSANLTLVRVANLRAADNEVDYAAEEPDDPMATVERVSPTEALVRWEPDAAAQQSLAAGDGAGLQGLLEVQYDVARSGNASELVVGDGGYFVHFFAPPDNELPPLPKHVVFLLDTSGSMFGRKIQQLKEAMAAILSELRESDTFSLLTFASGTKVWTPAAGLQHLEGGEPPAEAVAAASARHINDAQTAINDSTAYGATHMYDALQAAFAVVRLGRAQGSGVDARQPLVFFLTDGEPNGPHSSHAEIGSAVGAASNSSASAPLYSLAFGQGADFDFLKKLSLRGKGFARKIYEAADAALQLRNFYRRVASPLLANVTFQYADDQVDLTSLTVTAFPVHLEGTELAVAGRLRAANASNVAEGQAEAEVEVVELQATVVGDGAPEHPVARPAVVERLPPLQATFVERLWAYLTVRQLLERASGDDAAARERARQLALRYAFVTSLTSLVVVKPENQTSGADLRDAADGRSQQPQQPRFAASPGAFSPRTGGYAPASMSGGIPGDAVAARAFISGPSSGWGPRRSSVPRRLAGLPGPPSPRSFEDGFRDSSRRKQTPTSSPASTPTELVPLTSLQWLTAPSGNETHVYIPADNRGLRAFIVAEPTGAEAVEPATARNCTAMRAGTEIHGRCLPLPHCPLRAFADDVANFLPFFCALGDHAGVCCPEEVVQAQIAQQTQPTQQTQPSPQSQPA